MQAISKSKRISTKVRQDAGRIRSQKKPAQKRTRGDVGNAFLRHVFSPFLCLPESANSSADVEQLFFESVDNISRLYGLKIAKKYELPYPSSILKTFAEVKLLMSDKEPSLGVHLIQDSTRLATIATAKDYGLGMTLFYLPIQGICRLSGKRNRRFRNLLISMCACLYRSGISTYTDGFVGSTYDMMYEMAEDDFRHNPKDDEYLNMISDLNCAQHHGLWFEKQIACRYHSDNFSHRVTSFTAGSEQESHVLTLAERLLSILNKYPERNLLDSIHVGLYTKTDDYYCEERTRPDQYLSFFWDDCDSFNHAFWELINSSLQEHVSIEVPVAVQYFDSPQEKPIHDLSYEKEMFSFLDDFCSILYQLT